MGMGILAWVIFGALAGWVASMIMGINDRQGCLGNIVVGVIGAFVGGLVVELLGGGDMTFAFNIRSFVVAVIGAVLLLGVVSLMRGRR